MGTDSAWPSGGHGPLEQLADGLWVVDAELSLLPIGRRMTIARDARGDLTVHSAVACDESVMKEIDALGPVRTIVVPNHGHKIDAPRYAARYPDAKVVTPRAGLRKVERAVAVHGVLDEFEPDACLRVEMLDGVPFEGVLVHTDPSGDVSLVFNDALMNLPDHLPGFKGWLVGLLGSTGGPKVTKIAKSTIVRDPRAYGQHLLRLSNVPRLTRAIVSHGAVIEGDVSATLRRVAATLGA